MNNFSIQDLESLESRIKQQQEDIQRLIIMKKSIKDQQDIMDSQGLNQNQSRGSIGKKASSRFTDQQSIGGPQSSKQFENSSRIDSNNVRSKGTRASTGLP